MSLKTAGIIVASIELILAIGSMVLVPVLMISIFDVIANILWLYGLYVVSEAERNSDFPIICFI